MHIHKTAPMKNIIATGFVFVLFLTLIFSSCTKRQEDRIAETWRLIRVDVDSTITWYELWQFDGESVIRMTRDSASSNLDTLDQGLYSVQSGLSKTIITVQDFTNTSFNGDWEVLKLNKEIMVILNTTDGGWLYREFVIE